MDPYCVIENVATGVQYKTPTHEDAGKNPKWNHSFEVLLNKKDDLLRLAVYDEDVIEDELIGEESYQAPLLLANKTKNSNTFQINFKGKRAGDVTLSATLVKNNPQQKELKIDKLYSRNQNNFSQKNELFDEIRIVQEQPPMSRN